MSNRSDRLPRCNLGTEDTTGDSTKLGGELVETARARPFQNREDDRVVLGEGFYSGSGLCDLDLLESGRA